MVCSINKLSAWLYLSKALVVEVLVLQSSCHSVAFWCHKKKPVTIVLAYMLCMKHMMSQSSLGTTQGFTQWPTYPQLLVNGELLGGCDIIVEMQQDGSLKAAVQEALGTKLDTKTSVQQRIKQLLGSKPVMLFMKVPIMLPRLLAALP